MTELLVILVVALLIFGPNKLPELARSLGRGVAEFRRASSDLRQSLMEASEERTPDPPKPAASDASPGEGATPKATPSRDSTEPSGG